MMRFAILVTAMICATTMDVRQSAGVIYTTDRLQPENMPLERFAPKEESYADPRQHQVRIVTAAAVAAGGVAFAILRWRKRRRANPDSCQSDHVSAATTPERDPLFTWNNDLPHKDERLSTLRSIGS